MPNKKTKPFQSPHQYGVLLNKRFLLSKRTPVSSSTNTSSAALSGQIRCREAESAEMKESSVNSRRKSEELIERNKTGIRKWRMSRIYLIDSWPVSCFLEVFSKSNKNNPFTCLSYLFVCKKKQKNKQTKKTNRQERLGITKNHLFPVLALFLLPNFYMRPEDQRAPRPGDECVEAYHETTGVEDGAPRGSCCFVFFVLGGREGV